MNEFRFDINLEQIYRKEYSSFLQIIVYVAEYFLP